MRKGIFSKLAVQNIRNNKSTYIPYMITCIFCIAMIYMMEFLRDCPSLDQAVRHAAEVRMVLSTGEVIVIIFCVIFLIYSNSFLMKRRQKEIGLYNILGLERNHIAIVLLLETIFTAILSLSAGIASGIRAQEYSSYYADNASLLFIGIFLGSLFLLGTAMIIYYKQISEGYEDQKRFEIMQKVGLTHREVKSSIRRQILMVFFLPLLMAMLHISMAFPLIRRMLLLFGMTNTKLFVGCTAGTVLIFGLVYGLIYLMTAKSYYHIVERK